MAGIIKHLLKAKVTISLQYTLLNSIPEMRNDHQRSIDITWRTHRPPEMPASVGVTPNEVIATIRRMRVGVAPGWDGIPIRVFQKCILIILPWFVVVFSGSLHSGHVLLEWCTARVLALHKPSKSDYTSPKSYRPISPVSPMGKILENIVNKPFISFLVRVLGWERGHRGMQPFG